MLKKTFFLLFLAFSISQLYAQAIQKITVSGNKKTLSQVITREMKLKPGSFPDSALIELDRRKIESLGLFDRVEAVFVDSSKTLKIIVDERWFIWPVPEVFNTENSFTFSKFKNIFSSVDGLAKEKVTLKLSLKHTNFRGNNEKLSASVSFGYNAGYELDYLIPWLTDKKLIFHTLLFRRGLEVESKTDKNFIPLKVERLEVFEQGGTFSLGKKLGFEHKIFLGFGFREVKKQKNQPEKEIFLSEKEKDKLPSVLFSYVYDTRDLIFYPRQGIFAETIFEKVGFGKTRANYLKTWLDTRYFLPLTENQVLGFHVFAQSSKGKIPTYERFVLGSKFLVRGHYKDQKEGENLFLTSIAYRFPIFKIRYYKVPSFAFMEEYTDNFKFGVSGELFFDAGNSWFERKEFDEIQKGFGFGLNFHIPYREVIRLEAAFDEKFKPEILLGIFVSF